MHRDTGGATTGGRKLSGDRAIVSEAVQAKATRYLAEGRLTIESVHGDEMRAVCRGRIEYTLGHKRGSWFCTCPARRTCAHLVALQLVTIKAQGVADAL